jgi:hypothetical protein
VAGIRRPPKQSQKRDLEEHERDKEIQSHKGKLTNVILFISIDATNNNSPQSPHIYLIDEIIKWGDSVCDVCKGGGLSYLMMIR